MNTSIGYQPIYYTVYLKKPSPSSPPFLKVIGAYTDIRDAIQAIVSAYRRNPDPAVSFGLESSVVKPKHWLHPSKYRDGR